MNTFNAAESWLTPKSIALSLDISSETVRAWCRSGSLPHQRVGRQIRIDRIALEKFLNQQHPEELPCSPETGKPSLNA